MTGKNIKKSKVQEAKQRLIYVYLPSNQMLEKWKSLSEKAVTPLSKFVVEHVENSLQQEENKEGYRSRSKLLDDIRRIQEENKELNKRVKYFEILVSRLEEEVRRYRAKPFLEKDFSGVRKYEEALIKMFKIHSEVHKEEVLEHLGINPMEIDAIKGIQKQLENLENYGLIKDVGGKWRWKG
ncbi:Uncharacterised protein [uncultured archaeon]|nr:Uncharacterised protein [uncultured archaeon]